MDLMSKQSDSPPFVFTRWHTSFDLVSDVWWARKNTFTGRYLRNTLMLKLRCVDFFFKESTLIKLRSF